MINSEVRAIHFPISQVMLKSRNFPRSRINVISHLCSFCVDCFVAMPQA
jgi:hypothetical protein